MKGFKRNMLSIIIHLGNESSNHSTIPLEHRYILNEHKSILCFKICLYLFSWRLIPAALFTYVSHTYVSIHVCLCVFYASTCLHRENIFYLTEICGVRCWKNFLCSLTKLIWCLTYNWPPKIIKLFLNSMYTGFLVF